MFIWYWTYLPTGEGFIDDAIYAWTDIDFVKLCIIRPSDCCMMVPPEDWNCD